tara:strand:+ start:541 stop:984 length:444 start_codon:yes stop_codon:yes gene_type:complete
LKKLTIVPEDNMVVVDGEALVIDVVVDADIHAIQWDEETQVGTIEYKSGRSIKMIGTDEITPFLSLVTSHANEKTRIASVIADEEARALEYEGLYSTKRTNAFYDELTIGDQLDGILRFIDSQSNKSPEMQRIIDKSKEIKTRFPKS